MNFNTVLIYIFLFLNIIEAQGYTLDDCIQIAIDEKKTVLSAEIGVVSASKGVKASYSGILPSIQASGGGGVNYFPEQVNFDLEELKFDTTNYFET